jgi:hypothetical protein
MSDRDYVLGTQESEIERLAVQHRVWRTRALDLWDRAGVKADARLSTSAADQVMRLWILQK